MKDIRSMFRLYAYNHGIYDDDTVILRDYFLDNRLSRDTLNDKIMLDIGERYSYWSHTELLKRNIDNWFLAHANNISKLIDSTEYEFDALHLSEEFYEDVDENKNKLRTDNLTETKNSRETKNLDETEVNTENTVSNVDSTNQTTDIQEISAYDSDNYQPQNKSASSSTAGTDSTTELSSNNNKESTLETNNVGTISNTGTVSNTEDNENRLHHYGNKTNPDYTDNIRKERELELFNIYDWITSSLAEDICLGIY